jgi:hypothetical protein
MSGAHGATKLRHIAAIMGLETAFDGSHAANAFNLVDDVVAFGSQDNPFEEDGPLMNAYVDCVRMRCNAAKSSAYASFDLLVRRVVRAHG